MPTIKNSLYFNYDGISSKEFNLIQISTSNGMYEEIFIGSRDIRETKVTGNDIPFFHGLDNSSLEFEMQIAFDGFYDDVKINNIILWLFQDRYKPLYFEDNPDKIFYCMPISDSSIFHNGLKEGYLTIKMRCNSPYIYSPVYLTDLYDLSSNTVKYSIEISNNSHFNLFPEIFIEKVGVGNITLTNVFNGGDILDILNLADAENIYINCKKEIIETDIIGVYRYDNVVGDFIELPIGNNIIQVEGKCKIQFRYQYQYKF